MPGLSAALLAELAAVVDCTVTLRRGADDRLSEARVLVTTGWDVDRPRDADHAVLARYVAAEPDEDGWVSA